MLKKAIQDAGGNLTRAAALLGCTRQTLYTWIYQNGLDRLAGVRPHTGARLDRPQRMDNRSALVRGAVSDDSSAVKSGAANRPMLRVVEAQAVSASVVTVTVKMTEDEAMRLKIKAVRERTTMGAIVSRALELLEREEPASERSGRRAGKQP